MVPILLLGGGAATMAIIVMAGLAGGAPGLVLIIPSLWLVGAAFNRPDAATSHAREPPFCRHRINGWLVEPEPRSSQNRASVYDCSDCVGTMATDDLCSSTMACVAPIVSPL
jgi:hypothetical protein